MVFVNDEKNELFFHIPKCGGCHIRTHLLNYYNYTDFFTNEKHHKLDDFCDIIDETINDKHTITKRGKYRFFLHHQNYDEKYQNYFKYTFVRNPYDKLYSAYLYLKENIKCDAIRGLYENKNHFVDFKTFIENRNNVNNISYFHAFITQYDQLINDNGIIEMNYIGNVETLDEDFLYILNNRGIDININHKRMLFENVKTNSTDDKNILKEYNQEILNFVNEYFKNDFTYFGYKKYETIEEFANNYYNDIEYIKNSKNNLDQAKLETEPHGQFRFFNTVKMHKIANVVEYNVKLLEELCKEYECVKTNYEYKLESLNDNKSALFFKVFEDIQTLKQLSGNAYQEHDIYKCKNCNLSCYNNYTYEIHKYDCQK